jgi:hypothetical protein
LTETLETLARGYFERVRAKDAAGVAARFAADGLLRLPNGKVVAGRAAIGDYYRKILDLGSPNPAVRAVVTEGRRCVVEIHAHRPDGTPIPCADIFTFDAAGEVTDLTIYTVSPPEAGR